MSKVIVERSRLGGKYSAKGRKLSFDDLPKKESMRKKHSGNRKTLNENLNPLIRFLHSKIGKSWDKVFSEICQNIKLDSAVQKHVRDHVFDYVFVNVKMEDNNKVLGQRKYSGKFIELRNNELYVHPKTGILKKYKTKNIYTKNKFSLEKYLDSILSNKQSKFVLIDLNPFRMYYDKYTDSYVHKQNLTSKDAIKDFKYIANTDYLISNLNKFSKKINIKHEYFKTIFELYDKFLENKESERLKQLQKLKETQYFKVGETVEFSKNGGKDFVKGIINRIEQYGNHTTFWITVGTTNEHCSDLLGRLVIRKIKG